LGFIRRRITPDAPRIANAEIIFPIIFLQYFAQSSELPEAEIITPATSNPIKLDKRIIETIILLSHHINTGKAFVSSTTNHASGCGSSVFL